MMDIHKTWTDGEEYQELLIQYSHQIQTVNITSHLHEVKSAQTSAPKTALVRPFIK
jgi:hypothetical protein